MEEATTGMNYIFNGSIIGSLWQDGLERLLLYWLTRSFPSPWSAYTFDHLSGDVFRPKFTSVNPVPVVSVPHLNPHRLQRDFLFHQAGLPPRTVRVSRSNGPLGNVAVIRRVPVNNQPVAGRCLIWRGSLSGSRNGTNEGYGQFGGRAFHRIMFEESRCEGLGTEDKVLHLCHRRGLHPAQPSLPGQRHGQRRGQGEAISPALPTGHTRWKGAAGAETSCRTLQRL